MLHRVFNMRHTRATFFTPATLATAPARNRAVTRPRQSGPFRTAKCTVPDRNGADVPLSRAPPDRGRLPVRRRRSTPIPARFRPKNFAGGVRIRGFGRRGQAKGAHRSAVAVGQHHSRKPDDIGERAHRLDLGQAAAPRLRRSLAGGRAEPFDTAFGLGGVPADHAPARPNGRYACHAELGATRDNGVE